MKAREQQRWALWTAVGVLALPLLYVGSFGPACWWLTEAHIDDGLVWNEIRFVPRLYWPMGWLVQNGSEPVRTAINDYGTFRNDWVLVPSNATGTKSASLVKRRS